MALFKSRFLLLNSFCWFLLGCVSQYNDLKPVNVVNSACVRKFIPRFHSDLYTASVDVIGKHLSGLLFIKTMPDSAVRIVFTNEVGVTFFDFEFTSQNTFNVHQVISQLNKRPVIELLRNDFELILMRPANQKLTSFTRNDHIFYAQVRKKETDYFITDKDCASLLRIERASKRVKKVEVQYTHKMHTSPDSVYLQHFTFNMKIALKKVQR